MLALKQKVRSDPDLTEVDKNLFEAVLDFNKNKFSKIIERCDTLKMRKMISLIVDEPIILETYLKYCQDFGFTEEIRGYHFMELTNYSSITILCNYIKNNEDFEIPIFDIRDNDKINYLFICGFITSSIFVIKKFANIESEFDDIDPEDVFNDLIPFESLFVTNKMYIISEIFINQEYHSKYFDLLIDKYSDLVVYQYLLGSDKPNRYDISEFYRLKFEELIKNCNFNSLIKYDLDFDYKTVFSL